MRFAFGMGIIAIPVMLFMLLLPIALLVALQVWLCKRSVRLGLILPGISLALSLMITFSLAAFSAVGGVSDRVTVTGGASYVLPNGQEVLAIESSTETEKSEVEFRPQALAAAGVIFLVTNIPTAVFGGIWLHYKGRRDTMEDLKRMRIEDLG